MVKSSIFNQGINMSSPAVVLFFTLMFIYTTFTHATIAEQNTFKKYINSSMITIAYHKNLPYKKAYGKSLIPGCKKIDTNRAILICTEYIQLIRPMTLIKKWQDTQKKTGYLPITLPEFNILNEAGKIISISPAATYSKYLLSETNSTGHMVTGKFIRHSDKVGHYIFTTGKDSVIDNINATDNHLFYVRNRNKFIPIGKIRSTDLLINEEGKTIYLKHSISGKDKDKDKDKESADKIPEVVYNLEISSNHTYFAGRQKILVHNRCFMKDYFHYLEGRGLIHEENNCMRLKYHKDNISSLLLSKRDSKIVIESTSAGPQLPSAICSRLQRLALVLRSSEDAEEQIWEPVERMSLDLYKKNLPCITKASMNHTTANVVWKVAAKMPDFLSSEKLAAQKADGLLKRPFSATPPPEAGAGKIPRIDPHPTDDSAADLFDKALELLNEHCIEKGCPQ